MAVLPPSRVPSGNVPPDVSPFSVRISSLCSLKKERTKSIVQRDRSWCLSRTQTNLSVAKYRTILPTARTLFRITSFRAASAARRGEKKQVANQRMCHSPKNSSLITYLHSSCRLEKKQKKYCIHRNTQIGLTPQRQVTDTLDACF